jgi:hypothetical protein
MFKTLSIFATVLSPKEDDKMKAKILTIACFVALAVASLSSCSTKLQAINRLEALSDDLRDNSRYYSLSDWQQAGEQFMKIRKDIAKHEFDYTPEQKKRIGELEGKCAGYMAKGAKEGIFDKIKGFGNEINGVIQGILNTMTDFVE